MAGMIPSVAGIELDTFRPDMLERPDLLLPCSTLKIGFSQNRLSSRERIALPGLVFKGGTDDIRESRAIPIAKTLLSKGATVVGYDISAHEGFSAEVPGVEMARSIPEALSGSHGCIIQADLPEFESLTANDFLRTMHTPVVIDGRSVLNPELMDGIRFHRIG